MNRSTGFGLMLVQMLAEQLAGTFTMSSDHGAKSVVTFEL
ncbi:MAG: sensor histidine kinase [bacterium]|nr:sensor histidine kinase [bacterium]